MIDSQLWDLLCLVSPSIRPIVDRHRAEYGEILGSVLLGELAHWSFDPGNEQDRLLAAMSYVYDLGGPWIRNEIAVGFVEGIPTDARQSFIDRIPGQLAVVARQDLGLR